MRHTRGPVTLAMVALIFLVGGALAARALERQDAFPHDRHAALFPFCEGCHVMETGSRATMYPATALCARCHDGQQVDRVSWTPQGVKPTLLRFDHVTHIRATADEPVECAQCHARDTNVVRVQTTCFDCHAHAASHYENAKCSTCHVPITQTNVPASLTLELPQPRSHADTAFIRTHGTEARNNGTTCQYCHSRQQCASCHVNAGRIDAINALETAPAGVQLAKMNVRWPEPASHRSADFLSTHGSIATAESCSTCHTRDSCSTCHATNPPPVVAALPAASPGGPQGVSLARTRPSSHARPGFGTNHGTLAATDRGSCTTCHTTNYCAECHSAPAQAAFHSDDFMARHSSAAYTRRLECANCHDPKAFCRECHASRGQSPAGGRLLSSVYHDAEPLWLLRHGGAARRGLESCTTCHAQRDCLQCHSTIGAFRVNPHGNDFDAKRAQQKNPIICKACHIGDPIAR
jgi:hypothetical protein